MNKQTIHTTMDNLILKTGGFGTYQKKILIILSLISSLAAIVTYSSVFNTAKPKLECNYKNDFPQLIDQNITVCDIVENIAQSGDNSSYTCSYDKTYYGNSIVTEWDLVCDKVSWTSFTQTVFMIGALSSVFVGSFSDKYGRRTAILILTVIFSMSIILCEILQYNVFNLSNDYKYYVYAVTQFFLGFTSFSLYVVSYILIIELSITKYSMLASVIFINIYVIGELLLLAAAYLLRDWHLLNWFIASYSLMALTIISYTVPESPKFLITNKRYEEAAYILTNMAKTNGVNITITEKDITNELHSGEAEKMISEEENTVDTKKTSVIYYLTHPLINLVRTIILAYQFISLSMIYFGISLGITSVSADFNPYGMYFLSSIAEAIGYSMGLLDRKISRKIILIVTLVLSGILCLSVAMIPITKGSTLTWNNILVIVNAIVGKIMASCAFNLIYLYGSQVFPTGVRNTLVSYVSCAGRIGSIISPQINLLGQIYNGSLPYIIFSASAFLSAILFVPMPDTAKLKHDV